MPLSVLASLAPDVDGPDASEPAEALGDDAIEAMDDESPDATVQAKSGETAAARTDEEPEANTVRGDDDRPDLASLILLADGARIRERWDEARAGYLAALLVAPETEKTARADLHARIGSIELARGRLAAAARAYGKAASAQPKVRAHLDALVTIALESEEWNDVVAHSRERLALLEAPAERVDEHFAIARTLVEKLRDVSGAAQELELAEAIDATRDDVLEALRRSYRVLARWPALVKVTGRLADLATSQIERAGLRVVQAKIARDKMNDTTLAIERLEAALEADATNDEALDLLVEARLARAEHADLARTLEGLVDRLDDMGETERASGARLHLESARRDAYTPAAASVADVAIQSIEIDALDEDFESPESFLHGARSPSEAPPSAIYATIPAGPPSVAPPRLEDLEDEDDVTLDPAAEDSRADRSDSAPSVKIAAAAPDTEIPPPPVEEAADAIADRPSSSPESTAEEPAFASTDLAARAILAAELVAHGDDEGALIELDTMTTRAPLHAAPYKTIFTLNERANQTDAAYLAALALEELGAADGEHRAAIDTNRTDGALRARASLDDDAWAGFRAPGSDDVAEQLFGAISRAAVATYIEERRERQRVVQPDPSKKQSETSTASVVRSFHWAARVLDVTCPDLYVVDDEKVDIAALPTAAPSTALGPDVLSGLSTKSLAFLTGRHLTYYRPEHLVLLYYPTLNDLSLLLLAAAQLALPAMAAPPAVAQTVNALRKGLARNLTRDERASAEAAVMRLDARGGRVDLAAWIRSVELTAQRVGMFLAGDLRTAALRVRDPRAFAGLDADTKRADLVSFCASRAHADLRHRFALLATEKTPQPGAITVRKMASAAEIKEEPSSPVL